jgi:hypothetical protein
VFADSDADAFEVLAQPVVPESNAGIGIRLRFSGLDQRGERFKLVDEAREGFAFGVAIGESWKC